MGRREGGTHEPHACPGHRSVNSHRLAVGCDPPVIPTEEISQAESEMSTLQSDAFKDNFSYTPISQRDAPKFHLFIVNVFKSLLALHPRNFFTLTAPYL